MKFGVGIPMTREKTSEAYAAVNMRRRDKVRFDALRSGKTAVQFISDIIDEKACTHPIEQRIMLSVSYMADGSPVKTNRRNNVTTILGYFCRACKRTVIPEPILQRDFE